MQLASMNVFMPWDNWKTSFFIKGCHYFVNCHTVAFLETNVFRKVHILHYLRNNNAALIPKFQKSYHVLYFRILLYDKVFYTHLRFTLFFVNKFFRKFKTYLKIWFLHSRIFADGLVFIRWLFVTWKKNYIATSTF